MEQMMSATAPSFRALMFCERLVSSKNTWRQLLAQVLAGGLAYWRWEVGGAIMVLLVWQWIAWWWRWLRTPRVGVMCGVDGLLLRNGKDHEFLSYTAVGRPKQTSRWDRTTCDLKRGDGTNFRLRFSSREASEAFVLACTERRTAFYKAIGDNDRSTAMLELGSGESFRQPAIDETMAESVLMRPDSPAAARVRAARVLEANGGGGVARLRAQRASLVEPVTCAAIDDFLGDGAHSVRNG